MELAVHEIYLQSFDPDSEIEARTINRLLTLILNSNRKFEFNIRLLPLLKGNVH